MIQYCIIESEVNDMGKTSSEVKARWMEKAYKKYLVNLRYDTDQDLIDFVEANKDKMGMTQIFREALAEYIAKQK